MFTPTATAVAGNVSSHIAVAIGARMYCSAATMRNRKTAHDAIFRAYNDRQPQSLASVVALASTRATLSQGVKYLDTDEPHECEFDTPVVFVKDTVRAKLFHEHIVHELGDSWHKGKDRMVDCIRKHRGSCTLQRVCWAAPKAPSVINSAMSCS